MNKYPRTPYWPTSPSIPNKEGTPIASPDDFVGIDVVITEKLDGCNTELRRGEAHVRGGTSKTKAPWLAMAKKHHAWKTIDSPVSFFGEDIYGVHSIEYDSVLEEETFYMFAGMSASNPDYFMSWWSINEYARQRDIPIVPLLHYGKFSSVEEIESRISDLMNEPSSIGGDREGVVIRTAKSMWKYELNYALAKFVRPNHVQVNATHWRKNWKPCKIKGAVSAAFVEEETEEEEW